MEDFRNLKVWQKAHRMVLDIYRVSALFPADERFGVVSQIRRAGVSVPSNLAEGCSRDGGRDFCRYLRISLGSANEVQYLLLLARDLRFLGDAEFARMEPKLEEVRRMQIGLLGRVGSSSFRLLTSFRACPPCRASRPFLPCPPFRPSPACRGWGRRRGRWGSRRASSSPASP